MTCTHPRQIQPSRFSDTLYPPLLAGGAFVIEQARRPLWGVRLGHAYVWLLLVSGLVLAPLAMPVLAPATFTQTYGALSSLGNASAGQQTQGVFPQYLSDRFGWTELAAQVSRIYQGLPAQEKAQACILTENYGEAAAPDFYRDQYHLPPVLSGHNNYFLWGPGACSGKVLIAVNIAAPKLQRVYRSVTPAGTTACAYCISSENELPIFIARNLSSSLPQVWPVAKHFS